MLEIGLPRPRMIRTFLQDSRAVSRFSSGPVAGNNRQHVFDPTGSNAITFPDQIENTMGDCNIICPSWIEKVLTVISCNWAPGEAGNSSG